MQGIRLLIVLVGRILRDKGEDLKQKTKKEMIHDIIDQIGDRVESDVLTVENVTKIVDHALDF